MNYQEAIKLAQAWTKDHDVELDGWRSVILLLFQRVQMLEAHNVALQDRVQQLESKLLKLD
jgi:hypothetical protein